ncbi:MORC family CW-type zinc finger protein 3 Nuclear matrix protein 2 [Channa argus]|uniref:MORC family CW-type zinc finger protein 3 Nuclear matrix protein 2 n=1 Tax=Channa argus TaxID=215402 RepID=A0A6G1PUQ1_CHAAH|nr:MORC family CW-type zinc finger protein 3 Nuclear matrix protein 2 [Channa argus]
MPPLSVCSSVDLTSSGGATSPKTQRPLPRLATLVRADDRHTAEAKHGEVKRAWDSSEFRMYFDSIKRLSCYLSVAPAAGSDSDKRCKLTGVLLFYFQMSPSFLNSNSTSHTWPFSAVAELIDNASDPGVSAKQIWIDVVKEADHHCLTFTDNGSGMTPYKLHKMLSFGFTEKGSGKSSLMAIGVYGNGFKSGSMRLGRDALIFTKNEDSEASLAAILQHSILTSQEQIHAQFDSILSKKGTKILIWNIRRAKDGKPEIDFESDADDFRLPEIQIEELKKGLRNSVSLRAEQNIPDMHYSLRASGQRAGVGVIGIIECNFLKPAHNKQDFEYTKEYRLTLGALGLKLNDYWKEVTEKKAREREFQALDRDEDEDKHDADNSPMWVQCEECLKWRSVSAHHYSQVPESWNCSQNPNPRYREHQKSRKREKSLEVCEIIILNIWYFATTVSSATSRLLFVLQSCQFQDPVPKHQIISRSSSEPSQPTFASTHTPDLIGTGDQCHTEEDTPEHDQTYTDHHTDTNQSIHTDDEEYTQNRVKAEVTHTQQGREGGDVNIKDKTQVENEAEDPGFEGEETDNNKGTNTEPMGAEEKATETGRHKRKLGSLFHCLKKKPYLWEERQPDSENVTEEVNSEKQTNVPETFFLETKTKQDCSNQVEKSGDSTQQTPTTLTWTHSLPSTQTLVVSPLSRTEGTRPLPLEGSDREAKMQKLVGLEKEVQRLRKLLGLEITKTSQGTMTVAESSTENPKEPAASSESREVGCQTDVAESSTSSSRSARALLVQGQRAVCVQKEQPEQNRTRKERTETQSRMRVGDSEACEDSRSAQENLQGIRNNVVILLTALLPQLDLNGISLETTDVDSILQQIIEVNSLKL